MPTMSCCLPLFIAATEIHGRVLPHLISCTSRKEKSHVVSSFLSELEDDGSMPLIIRNYEVKVIGDTAHVFHQVASFNMTQLTVSRASLIEAKTTALHALA